MEIIRTVAQLRKAVETAKLNQKKIGLVPTMGALHEGHMSLVQSACADNDVETYPRTEEADCEKLRQAGVHIAFVPSVEEVYPEPDTRIFNLGPVAEVMEGAMRPGHFNGVAQVVSRLFEMVRPDRAYFGEKDFQQIAVIRRMVELEGFNLEIVPCPIVRADDGLALSSRNVRLSEHQRDVAPNIHRILKESLKWAETLGVEETATRVADAINQFPEMEVEYYKIVDQKTMQPVTDWYADGHGAVGCITVYLGDVRLIDNIKYPIK